RSHHEKARDRGRDKGPLNAIHRHLGPLSSAATLMSWRALRISVCESPSLPEAMKIPIAFTYANAGT
ncbi:MAG: hypothetical protein ACJ8EL_13615, partial [Rhizomicrobium sp.]